MSYDVPATQITSAPRALALSNTQRPMGPEI